MVKRMLDIISLFEILFPMKTLGHRLSRLKKINIDKNNLYVTYSDIHKTEKFWYPINDVILKRWKELVKTMLVTLSGKVLF